VVLVSILLAASVVGSTHALAKAASGTPTATSLATGRALYRQFCGKCHALNAALAAGFGSGKKDGLGTYGGPSFNELRVPYASNVTAVTLPTGGHERLRTKISHQQLHNVSLWIARVTRNHPIPALSTDG
jgi:mono/diheme cytochrome c family protein